MHLTPLAALILGWFYLAETPSPYTLAGGFRAMFGTILATPHLHRRD